MVGRSCSTLDSTPVRDLTLNEEDLPSEDTVPIDQWRHWGIMMQNHVDSTFAPETAFANAIAAHHQLQSLTRQWNPEANCYLCGSVVTHGQIENKSDLDFCCMLDDAQPPKEKQVPLLLGLHKHLKRIIPSRLTNSFVDLTTPRTPVIKLQLLNKAEVAPTKGRRLSRQEKLRVRTVHVWLPNVKASSEQLEESLSKRIREVGSKVERIHVRTVTDEFLPQVPPSDDPEEVMIPWDNSMLFSGMKATVRCSDLNGALAALGHFPDGQLVRVQEKRDLVHRDFADPRVVPELLRYEWDLNFAGFAVRNSYLIRKYLHNGDSWFRYGALALKAWGKATNLGLGLHGFLTTYAITILWLYFLLVKNHTQWIDLFKLPLSPDLPIAPKYSPMIRGAPELVAQRVCDFYRFYAYEFDYENEVVSLNRNRRSYRKDVNWLTKRKDNEPHFHYHFCIEDPYEEATTGGLNLGRHLDEEKYLHVRKEFAYGALMLMTTNPDTCPDSAMRGVRRKPLIEADEDRARKLKMKKVKKKLNEKGSDVQQAIFV